MGQVLCFWEQKTLHFFSNHIKAGRFLKWLIKLSKSQNWLIHIAHSREGLKDYWISLGLRNYCTQVRLSLHIEEWRVYGIFGRSFTLTNSKTCDIQSTNQNSPAGAKREKAYAQGTTTRVCFNFWLVEKVAGDLWANHISSNNSYLTDPCRSRGQTAAYRESSLLGQLID